MLKRTVPGWVLILVVASLAIGAGWTAGRLSARSAAPAAADPGGYDIGQAGVPAPTGVVRAVELVVKEARVEIAPGVTVDAITFNGQVPGPTIRATEGDTLRITVKNEFTEATAVHWHGLHVPNSMDGVPPLTQHGIEPGESFTYEFPASHAGTFMYHSHLNAVRQIDRGLYAPLIIEPATPPPARFDREYTMMLSAWDTTADAGHTMDGPAMGGMAMNYNYFLINGQAYPAVEPWTVRQGETVRVRVINISNLNHPMHLHGHDFTVIAKDGEPIRPQNQQVMNTLSVDPGETYDIVFRADNPGAWVFHCHELHHTENDGVEPGGLIQPILYEDAAPGGQAPPAPTSVPATAMPATMPGMDH